MPQIPANGLSLPLSHMQDLLAATDAFQQWTDSADADEAKEHIYLVNLPQSDLQRPFALIGFSDKWKREKIAQFQYQATGELYMAFEADVAEADQASESDAVFGFMNPLGAVIDEIIAIAGTDNYLNVIQMEMPSLPIRTNSEEAEMDEDYYQAEFMVVWSGI
ncbi:MULTISPECIES: hypothetical protein [unclassified Methylophaga]|uniref:hypothetical protein n=1 Tax=unclassified Methylophaga TaxID=2629249 RepID=UPI000C970EAA|nr:MULTISPECIES: hypothetical protein [unclassified Methylophaga]MBN46301.1 hypothetical protein [Methylophaga sp.]|tara:strand:- start:47904 stop:48392 length:489 start_codon:yes stop_codon:yes gene_type:complete